MTTPKPGFHQMLDAMAVSRAADPTSKAEPRTFAAAIHNARAPAWDPHEVWLTRVKQPRDLKKVG
jgi:hypothetical protein